MCGLNELGGEDVKEIKLSKLDDDTPMFREDENYLYEAREIKNGILFEGEEYHKYGDWYTAKEMKWIPCARNMVEEYMIQHYESGQMYEGWDEYALDCIDKESVKKIQKMLNEMFGSVGEYYKADKSVEIDISPNPGGLI